MMAAVFTSLLRGSRYFQGSQRSLRVPSKMETLDRPVENSIRKKLTAAFQDRPVENSIRKKLTAAFQPRILEVKNESFMHKVPKGSETHFKVIVVTDKFESLPLMKRHRLVNETLQEELNSGVHALAIVAKTPAQWEESEGIMSRTPPCRGGFGS